MTALKASVGRYVDGQSVEIAERNNPIFTSVNSASRTWNDTNGNYVPDCNLADFATKGECLPINKQNFLKLNPLTPMSATLQVKLNTSYPLPYDFVVSGIYQNTAGPQILANYAAPDSAIAPLTWPQLVGRGEFGYRATHGTPDAV